MYVYQEFPKCLYLPTGETKTVKDSEEQDVWLDQGYMTPESWIELNRQPAVDPNEFKAPQPEVEQVDTPVDTPKRGRKPKAD